MEELPKFLNSEDAEDLTTCQEKLELGKSRGVPEQHLQKLRDQIEFIKLGRDLEDEEVEKAKQMTVESTRRFVTSPQIELHTEFLLALAVLGSGNGEDKVTSSLSMRSRTSPGRSVERSPSLPELEDLEERPRARLENGWQQWPSCPEGQNLHSLSQLRKPFAARCELLQTLWRQASWPIR
eukprot:g2563.t1